MARKSKVLWGHTSYKGLKVPIYRVSGTGGVLSSTDAWTDTSPATGKIRSAEICIHSSNFHKAAYFDELLLHEFIHVIERTVGSRNLGHRPDPGNTTCTKSALVLGAGLAEMLRALEQANLSAKPYTTPVNKATRPRK